MYQVIKRYGHSEGWSCCFRQHLATHSHCRFLHGYALAFELTFESEDLNKCNWVIDFGGLKDLKDWLKYTFDHKTVAAAHDPLIDTFLNLNDLGLIDLIIIPEVGCEKFAEYVFNKIVDFYLPKDSAHIVSLVSVKVQEHEGNSAIYRVQ